jgi:hypothetical protein
MTFDEALQRFVEHNNAAVETLSVLPDNKRTPLHDHLVAAVNAASAIFVAMGLLPAPGEGCGECEACQHNAQRAVDGLLAELGIPVTNDPGSLAA